MKATDFVAAVYLTVVLLLFAIIDIRRKSLSLYMVVPAMLIMAVYSVVVQGELAGPLLGLIPGAGVAVLSFFTEGKIGLGDAFVLGTVGAWLGLSVTLSLFFVALLTCAVTGIVFMLLKKATRKTALPFVPFIFLGYMICEIATHFFQNA